MYIQYFIAFQSVLIQVGKVLDLVSALLDSNNEVNTMHLTFIKKLGLIV